MLCYTQQDDTVEPCWSFVATNEVVNEEGVTVQHSHERVKLGGKAERERIGGSLKRSPGWPP